MRCELTIKFLAENIMKSSDGGMFEIFLSWTIVINNILLKRIIKKSHISINVTTKQNICFQGI